MLSRRPRLSVAFCAVLSVLFGASAVRSADSGDTAPRVDANFPHAQPLYPDSAQGSGEQGTVMVDVYVRPSGRPGKAKISQSSGFADLDQAAVESVLNWRFVPAMRGDDTVSDWTTVKIVYQLPVLAPSPTGTPVH